MRQTELRDQFRAEVFTDPYAAMISRMVADAWASGYEEALRDHNLTEARLSKPHSDRVQQAVEWLTDMSRKSEAEAIIAMAKLGPIVHTGRLTS